MKILMKKILNLELLIVTEYQNTKTGEKKFSLLVKLKIQFHGPRLYSIQRSIGCNRRYKKDT